MGLVLGFLAAIAYTLLTYHPAMAGYKKPIFVKEEPKMRFEEEEKDDENEEIRSMYEDKKF
jgi:hypothetical protein